MNGNLVHFAGHRKHVGFCPAPTGIAKFSRQLAAYQGGKGSVQFPLDRPIPLDLIRDIVKFRAAENLQGSAARRRRRVTPAAVRRLALSFPGVEEGLGYGTPAWRVRGRLLAGLWEDGEVLVVKCGDQERDFRLQTDPQTFFTTDHYRGYPTVLVRLARITPAALRELLDTAWRREAPRRLVAEHDGRKARR